MIGLKRHIAVVLSIIIAGAACAGNYAGEFLNIGAGARAAGMGGAFCTLADDGFGFYWNPAGLAKLDNMRFSAMYAPMYGGFGASLADYQVLGVTAPFAGAAAGISWIRFSVADIPRFPDYSIFDYNTRRDLILDEDGEPEGWFSDVEEAVFFSFGRMNKANIDLGWQYFSIPLEIPAGLNIKFIKQKIAGYKSFGMGLDAGAQMKMGLQEVFSSKNAGDLIFAVNLQDISRTEIDWGDGGSDNIPMNPKWGIGYSQPFKFIYSRLNLAFDRDERYSRVEHWGAELVYRDVGALRIGLEGEKWTAGAGFSFRNFYLDYAFVNTDLGAVNRISAAYKTPH